MSRPRVSLTVARIPRRRRRSRKASIAAQQALGWGLINRVVPDEDLEDSSRKLLDFLAKGPTAAYANAKRLLNRTLYPDLAGQLEAEAEAQGEQGRTADFVEGVLAFTEKRPPNFTGR